MENTYIRTENSENNQTCDIDLHYTYNPKKKKFLKERGIRYVVRGEHTKTNKTFWAYLPSRQLSEALIEWRRLQEQRFNNN